MLRDSACERCRVSPTWKAPRILQIPIEGKVKRKSTPPSATALMESMRSIGYAFETALADIIDNSISAGASTIEVICSPYDQAFVAVLDDGSGMSKSGLLEAMRHGARNVGARAPENDLGRFGLGLKTASLSQCRRLTVLSKQSGSISGAEWNLDQIERDDDWSLLMLEKADFKSVPEIERLQAQSDGTLVVWRDLDRALAGAVNPQAELLNLIDLSREHLCQVFHRFLERPKNPLTIEINGVPVEPVDPFLRHRKGAQSLPAQSLSVEGQTVTIQPYILPHISRMSSKDISKAGGADGLRKNQGFYVYRNQRLISWGTWFRLARQEEMTKLARVLVDVPDTLDHLWSLDIKKSSAHPPDAVRAGLRKIVDRIAEGSRRVYTYRGRKAVSAGVVPAWTRTELREGRYSYQVNQEHPVVEALRAHLPDNSSGLLRSFIRMIEDTFPFDALYADMAAEQIIGAESASPEMENTLYELAACLISVLGAEVDRKVMLGAMRTMEPFCRYSTITEEIIEKLS